MAQTSLSGNQQGVFQALTVTWYKWCGMIHKSQFHKTARLDLRSIHHKTDHPNFSVEKLGFTFFPFTSVKLIPLLQDILGQKGVHKTVGAAHHHRCHQIYSQDLQANTQIIGSFICSLGAHRLETFVQDQDV